MSARASLIAVAILSVGIAAGCATTSAAVVNTAGVGVKATGQLFLATGAVLDAAYDSKLMTEPQYAPWRSFALRFKAVYPLAEKMETAAIQKSDQGALAIIDTELSGLRSELAAFQAVAASMAETPGASP